MMSIIQDDNKDLDDEFFLNFGEEKVFRYTKLNLPYSRQEKTIFNKNFISQREAQNVKSPVSCDLGKMLLIHSKSGDYSKVHLLLSKGAPFATDWLGMSSLHFAAKNNHVKICDLLIRAGVSKDGRTKVDKTPLHFAAYEGHEAVVQLLLDKKCDVNIKDILKMTPLHWAIEKRHRSIAKLLIEHGADVLCTSKFDKTPISMAIESNQADLIDELNTAKEVQNIEKSLMDVISNQKETNQAVKSIAGKSLKAEHANFEFEHDVDMEENEDDSKSVPQKSNPDQDHDDDVDVNMKDEENKYVEPIIQLENMSDDSHEAEASVLELLKSHGISLLPQEDPATSFISSALKSGRKFVLSEAGKLVLNETKLRQKSESPERKDESSKLSQIKMKDEKSIIKKKPLVLKAKEIPTSSGKKFKVISVETLKKMYGEELVNSLKKMKQGKSEKQIITHITKLSSKKESNEENAENKTVTNNKTVVEKTKESKESKENAIENDLPPNIEICTDSDGESDINIHIENEDKNVQKSRATLKFNEDINDDSNDDTKDDDDDNGRISYYRKSLPIQTYNKTSTIINKSLATNKTPIILNSQTISSLNHNVDNPEILFKRKNDLNRTYMMKKIQSNMKKESPIVPLLNIPEICRQLHELKKQTEELKKCNEEYRIRIEKLERKSLKD